MEIFANYFTIMKQRSRVGCLWINPYTTYSRSYLLLIISIKDQSSILIWNVSKPKKKTFALYPTKFDPQNNLGKWADLSYILQIVVITRNSLWTVNALLGVLAGSSYNTLTIMFTKLYQWLYSILYPLFLTGANILVFNEGRTVKLTDFGSSVKLNDLSGQSIKVGFTVHFSAPEVLKLTFQHTISLT